MQTLMNCKSLFFLMIVLISFLSSCVDRSPMEIHPEKSAESQHLGQGVWIEVPDGYEPARSYDGFQSFSSTSSISLQVDFRPIEEVKKAFHPEVLRATRSKLLEMRPVQYDTITNAFFAVVHDKRKGTIRYLLSVNNGLFTYNIKAFCLKSEKMRYDSKLKKALLSAYIGEPVEKEELFKIASLADLNNFKLTKDGNYPPQSDDEAVIEIAQLDEQGGYFTTDESYNYLHQALKKLTDGESGSLRKEKLENGMFVYGSASGEGRFAYVAMLISDAQPATVVRCSGTSRSNLSEFEEYVRSKFLRAGIRAR